MVIGIVGGGASGMAAAIAASEQPGAEVIVFERQARVGRKLQATGNGRCNLTNLHAAGDSYHGADGRFAAAALAAMPVEKTLDRFGRLGLYTTAEASGRVYPYSDQANSVVDVLRFALNRENIQLLTGWEVRKILPTGSGFRVEGAEESRFCHRVIVACGGLAGTKLGGSDSGYRLLRAMGHPVTPLRPALVQLKSDWRGCAALKGVRANCRAEIYRGDTRLRSGTGELQFTQYGLSGPVIFEISRDVCQGDGSWRCVLDFLPDMSAQALTEALCRRRDTPLLSEELFTGILHNRLGRVLTAEAGIRGNRPIRALPDGQIADACRMAKALPVPLTGTLGMDAAQVTAGGAATDAFDSRTLESRLVPGLYACGEVLDIDGDCGGYNLQWAWSSGYLAGLSAGGGRL